MSEMQKATPTGHDLVVGVDGTPASANALRYAVKEAARSKGTVHVHHVVSDHAPMVGMYPVSPDDLMSAGRAALEHTLDEVAGSDRGAQDDTVVTHLQRGGVVRTLVAAGRDARAVVLGSDRRSVPTRLLTGNVSTGVSARSAVPVVSVPGTWHADHTTGTVLAGVKHPESSESLMAEAFELARERASRLVVLHAWRFPAAYDDIIVSDRAALAAWGARTRAEVEKVVAPWRHAYPDVEVDVRTVHDYPAHALVTASADADELVIVRRAHGFPAAAHLGSTARTVLLFSQCPVRVVPSVHAPVLPDLELEADGVPLTHTSA